MANPRVRARLPLSARPLVWWLCGLILASAAVLAYWPGTSGDFLFDDFANLPALGRYGGVRDLQTFLYYLASGIADPTGRPVSMLSFLIDATDWPADPYPFKRTNILLHACNGLLLHGVLSSLGRRMAADNVQFRSAALLATALWLLHPLWTSTVLYIVQRHAMLAAFFVLAGVWAWIKSRDAFDAQHPRTGWAWAVLAVPVCGLLVGLSKANGFLLPLLLLTLHATVLRASAADGLHARRARRLFVVVPAAAVAIGLAALAWEASAGNARRSFGLGERLLSQPRALLEYLHQLLVPGLDNMGVFADGFVASASLLSPWTTLPALLLVVGMAIVGWTLRRAQPVVACALLFFLAGHALESGPVMLELYFEHRNYLPAAFLFWPIAWWLCAPGRYRRLRIATGIAAALLFLLLTVAQASLWANPLALARDWAMRNPDSARAQVYAAQQEIANGQVMPAEQRLAGNLAHRPDEPQFALGLLNLRCELGTVSSQDVDNAIRAVQREGIGLDITNQWLTAALAPASTHACARLPDEAFAGLLTAATSQPRGAEQQARSAQLEGLQALRHSRCEEAGQAFARRLDVQPRPEAVQNQVGLLAAHCGPAVAAAHLRHYLAAGAPVARAANPALRLRDRLMQDSWARHWQELSAILQEESSSAPARDPNDPEPKDTELQSSTT